MNVWGDYIERAKVRGITRRDTQLNREVRTLYNKLPESLSYHSAIIYDPEHAYNITSDEMKPYATERNFAIINSDNLNEKMIFSMPGEDIINGSLVSWMDQHWIVTERDANSTIYVRAKLIQCNYLLKWVSAEDKICEQWSIVEDGTKYLTGEYEDRHFVVTRGDSRIAVTIPRNSETAKLGRDNRFIIDDPDSPEPLAYLLTKPLKAGLTFNDQGIYKFVMQEVVSTDDDNLDLMIADYYKHFRREAFDDREPNPDDHHGRTVWL